MCKIDVIVSKNCLGPPEMKELNRLTDILLSIFEDQLDLGRLVFMDDAAKLLEKRRSCCEQGDNSSAGFSTRPALPEQTP